jgi:hypothetical protein
MKSRKRITGTMATALVAVTAIGFAAASCDERRDVSQKSSEASVVTNDNGSVFFVLAGFTVIYFITAAFFLPETKGRTLEEVEQYFTTGKMPEKKEN